MFKLARLISVRSCRAFHSTTLSPDSSIKPFASTFFSYYSSNFSISTKRSFSSTTTNTETTEEETEKEEEVAEEAVEAEDAVEAEEFEDAVEEEKDPEPSYEDKNPVHQGDTLFVRQRREFNQQLQMLRKDFVVDPSVQDGNKLRRKRKKEVRRKRATNKNRLKAILHPPPELLESLNDAKIQRKERYEMMQRIEKERKTLSSKYAKIRKGKVQQYKSERKQDELDTMKEMVLSGEFLTQYDQIDSWIERKLSDTSLQNPPAFLSEDVWGTWAHVEDLEGEEFLGEGGKSPNSYFFGR